MTEHHPVNGVECVLIEPEPWFDVRRLREPEHDLEPRSVTTRDEPLAPALVLRQEVILLVDDGPRFVALGYAPRLGA